MKLTVNIIQNIKQIKSNNIIQKKYINNNESYK
jgi:hypothetical protein